MSSLSFYIFAYYFIIHSIEYSLGGVGVLLLSSALLDTFAAGAIGNV